MIALTALEHPKEARLYKKKQKGAVICNLCAHRCYIPADHEGICKVRENRTGILYTLVYDRVISANIDPIEKKPLFHFLPGTGVYSIATVGCNFHCRYCQNWEISQLPRLRQGNDSYEELRDIALFLKDVDPEIPWHLSTFLPTYKLLEVEPTDRESLVRAWQIGKDAGLHHVYCGNLPTLHEDTLCYRCNETLIRRAAFNVRSNRLDRGRCPVCQTNIHGVWDNNLSEVSPAVTRAET